MNFEIFGYFRESTMGQLTIFDGAMQTRRNRNTLLISQLSFLLASASSRRWSRVHIVHFDDLAENGVRVQKRSFSNADFGADAVVCVYTIYTHEDAQCYLK